MRLALLLTMGVLAAASPSAHANAKVTGYRWFKFGAKNTTVAFGCDGIVNSSKENATGTLTLSLWALDAPYGDGPVKGKELATYKLKGLSPGGSYGELTHNATTNLPAARKAYTITMILSEFKNGEYAMVSYWNFGGTVVLEPLPMFTMSGPWKWRTSNEGGTIDIEVAKISHSRKAGTGTLKLVVWATKVPWKSSASGYTLGFVKKDALKAGYSYTNVKNTAQYTRPPPGYYFVTLLLTEFSDGEFKRQATLTSSEATLFR